MATGDSPIPMTVSVDRPWNARRIELPEATWLALASSTHLRSVEAAGAVVDGTTSGPAFVRRLHETRPGLALVVSPPAGTTELLAAIRERRQRATLRIVYLNESSAIEPRLEALALGFDDALPITIEPRELIGRIRLMLGGGRAPLVEPRRSTIAPGIELDFAARRALRDGSDVHLRPKEFALLASLASDPGRVFTRDELIDLAWGSGYRGNVRTIDVHVRWLRAKLEPDPTRPRLIATVRGLGYRLDPAAP